MATVRWLGLIAVVIVAAIGLGFLIAELAGIPDPPPTTTLRATGAVIAFAGAALALWTLKHHPARLMARVTARTIEIAMRKLTPNVTAVPRLITSGPYRYVRNPIYLGVLLMIEGLGLGLASSGLLLAGALLMAWWLLVVIPPEERELAAKFGDEYRQYRRRAGRFLPRLRR